MSLLQTLSHPLPWVALYALGMAVILTFLGIDRLRALAYGSVPRWAVMGVVMLSVILPPIALPFCRGPSMGLPRLISLGVGGLLFAANIAAKIAGQRRIGNLPALRAKGSMVTGGIYGIVRHPLYMSNGLMALGLALMLDNLYALIFCIPYCLGFAAIIHFEEIELIDQYGEAYRDYRESVPWRLVPKLY
jgi:protein-S-isoprenylcysteine O-methyltransferase Ste14